MILLDTNVISEAMRPSPDAMVMAWLNDQAAQTLYLSSVTLAELLFGIRTLPSGRRRKSLDSALAGLLGLFADRIVPFDADAARHYAELAAAARREGRGLPAADGYIAAIAMSRNFMVATRDTAPYEACGVRVINPWNTVPG